MRERAGRVDIWRQLTFEASTFGHGALVPPARKGIGTDENGSPEFAGLREQGAIGEIGQPEDDFDRHWPDFRSGKNSTGNPAQQSKFYRQGWPLKRSFPKFSRNFRTAFFEGALVCAYAKYHRARVTERNPTRVGAGHGG